MAEPEFWLRLADRVTGVLKSSRDNNLRFLWVDGFNTGTGNVLVELERNLVTLRAWIYGGKITIYTARLHLSDLAVEHWREGHWSALLPSADGSDWLSVNRTEGSMEILLDDT